MDAECWRNGEAQSTTPCRMGMLMRLLRGGPRCQGAEADLTTGQLGQPSWGLQVPATRVEDGKCPILCIQIIRDRGQRTAHEPRPWPVLLELGPHEHSGAARSPRPSWRLAADGAGQSEPVGNRARPSVYSRVHLRVRPLLCQLFTFCVARLGHTRSTDFTED